MPHPLHAAASPAPPRSLMSRLALGLATIALTTAGLFGSSAAQAVPPTPLVAPEGTAEIWVDFESDEARAAINEISSSSDATWLDAPATLTPFGVAATFPGSAGDHDVRVRVSPTLSGSFNADATITYAAASGDILSETTLRNATITPGLADAEGWITWSAIVEATDTAGGDDAGGGDSNNADSGDAGAHADRSGSLSTTGAPRAGWLILAAAGALGAGATALIVSRRKAAQRRATADARENGPTQ